MRSFLYLATSCLLLPALSALAQKPASRSFITDSVDSYINRAMQQWQIPGISIAVIKDDKILVMKGYGLLETGGSEKVNEHTLFGIGSNTKAFTGTAMAMLQEEKKLDLDDKVQKWIPDFTLFDPWVSREAILRDLLCHRLGFETFQGDFMYFDSDLSYRQVKEKMGKLKPMHGFRSKWGYTNAGFAIAGEVIEKASGQPWAQYLQTHIFKPAGMNRTLPLAIQMDTATNMARAHTVVEGKLRKIPFGHIDNLAPAGSIVSSAHDMSRWAKLLLNNGKLDNQSIIPETAIEQTRLPHSILGNGGHPFNKAHFSLYGLGWLLQEYEGRKLVEHTGGVNGFVTSFTLVPEENLGIVILTNTDANGFYEALKWELLDACLGLPYRDYNGFALNQDSAFQIRNNKTLKARRDTVSMKPAPALTLKEFTGNYNHEVYGRMNIALENNQLIARFEHHKGRFALLESLGGNRFLASFNDPLFGIRVWPFTIANGKVKSVTVTVSGFVEYTPYEFNKN